MDRREFLKSTAATAATGVLAGAGLAPRPSSAQGPAGPVPGPKPNILFILVDQLRFPSANSGFPAGVTSVDEFLSKVMPNLYNQLWKPGVKFASHYTAATACTPSRGTLITGLYNQQSWLMMTLTNQPGVRPFMPPLNPAYPTYGKLLRLAGYRTPYIGKWHCSFNSLRLNPYGFHGLTSPDPTGFNLQGTVGEEPLYHNDQYISSQAVQWLSARQPSDRPWCLTVSFVNPHDQQFFWAGTEFQTYNDLFAPSARLQPVLKYSTPDNPPLVSWDADPLKTPQSFGYPAVPPNWESIATLQANKPSTHVLAQYAQAAVWGEITDDANQSVFSIQPYPGTNSDNIGMGVAPYSYWQRDLDSYSTIMNIVDKRISEVVAALPSDVADNTIIVFAADHGEYAGAHGLVAGKILTCYEEAFHVPLIVVDPTGRFVGEVDTVRTELTSSVDFLPLLVSLGHNGSRDWISGPLAKIYGRRLDMLPMLKSASAKGRPYVLLATDELLPGKLIFNNQPIHIVGVRTQSAKLGTYSHWTTTGQIEPATMELEYYDYATPEGMAELANNPDDPHARGMLQRLLHDLIPNELQAPLPDGLASAQQVSRDLYLLIAQKTLNATGSVRNELANLLGYGHNF